MSIVILLAESNHKLQQDVANALNREQVEIVRADDGMSAMVLLNETCPDLLIAGTALTGKSGYALCRYIREEPEFQSLPVVLLDSNFDAFNQKRAYNAGADAYLNEPLEPTELAGTVRRLIESREASSSERPILKNYPESDKLKVTTNLPVAALLQAQKGRYVILWAILSAAILTAALLALLDRTHIPSDQTGQNQLPAGEMPKDDPLATEGQQVETPLWKEEPPRMSLGMAPPSEGNGALNAAGKDEDAERVETGSPNNQMVATGEPNPEIKRSETGQDSSFGAVRKDIPDTSKDRLDAQPTRPRTVRSIKSNTIGDHLKRSGREMKLAGKHFGSGSKHFGQGGGKATTWAGKKMGSGVKKMGKAFKKIF